MKLQPLSNNILIKRKEAVQKTPGGLFVPATAQETSMEAEVLAVGRGFMLENGSIVPVDVKVGDVVLVSAHSGVKVKVENEEYVIIQEGEVLGILT